MTGYPLGCVAAALLVGLAPAAVAAPGHAARPAARAERLARPISLLVNGETVETSTPPLRVDGRLVFPLRDVFAALGVSLVRTGDTIAFGVPTGSASVEVGSSTATVNGKAVPLGSPVFDRDGTTYAPLRLATAIIGAQTSYDRGGDSVEISSAFVGRSGPTQQARPGGGSDVQGVVAAVDTNSSPHTITIVRGGSPATIALTSDAKLWFEDVAIRLQTRATVADVRVGDAVHAILARDGRVLAIYDFFRSTSGTIAARSATSLVLQNGRVVTPGSETRISRNDVPVALADLRLGDAVTVRSNPESGELRGVIASGPASATAPPAAAAAGAPTIESVAMSAGRPLRAGQSFDVVLMGTPGGAATFDLGDYLTALPMRERAPGRYVGRFTIPERFDLAQVPVYGRLVVAGLSAPRAAAAKTLSATTVPPSIGEIAPAPGRRTTNPRPSIYATFRAPTDVGIDAASVTISVDGRDVTNEAVRTDRFVTYTPAHDRPDGPMTVEVKVSDAAGNASSKSWTFAIDARERS